MHEERQPKPSGRRGLVAAAIVYALTTLQLAIATFVPGLPQFEGKAFGARLVAYPLLMAAPPLVWWLAARRPPLQELPWGAFALVMSPFLVDATGNTLDLYDSVSWWDDLNHFANWLLLCWGCGLLLVRGRVAPAWALGLTIAGLGALLAIGWRSASGTRSSAGGPSSRRRTRTRSATRRSAPSAGSWPR